MVLFTLSPTLDHTKFNIWEDKLSPIHIWQGWVVIREPSSSKELPSEVQALKGQLWYVWVSIRLGACWLLLCSVRTPQPNCPINISPFCWELLTQAYLLELRIRYLRAAGWMLTLGAQLTPLFSRPVTALKKILTVPMNITRTRRKVHFPHHVPPSHVYTDRTSSG